MSQMQLGRRTMIVGASLGVAGVALAGAGALVLPPERHIRLIVQEILERWLPPGMFSEAAFGEFLETYAPVFRRRYPARLRLRWVRSRIVPATDAELELMERDVITAFLVGSDAFDAGRDPGPARYRGVPEACQNPFRRI